VVSNTYWLYEQHGRCLTQETGTVCPSGAPGFTSGFLWRVLLLIVFVVRVVLLFFYLRPVSCGPHISNINQSINNNHSKKLMCYQDKGRVCSDIRTRLFISRDSYVPYLWNGIMLFVSQVSFLDAQIDQMWQENNSPHIYSPHIYFKIILILYIQCTFFIIPYPFSLFWVWSQNKFVNLVRFVFDETSSRKIII